ncbi:Aldo/keto reductase, partial [Aureobasidium melanogenum]
MPSPLQQRFLLPVGFGLEDPLFMSEEEKNDRRYVNQYGLSRKHVFESVENILKRLDLDYIDLLQIHRFNPNTPVKVTMEALHDIVKSGKIRYIGASSMRAHQLLGYQYTARMHGWTEFVFMQDLYDAIYIGEEREMYPSCQKFGMGGQSFYGQPMTDSDKKINENIEEMAKTRGVSMAVIAIAYVQSKSFISAPVLGLNSIKRVDEAIEACEFRWSAEEVESIDDLYVPRNIITIGQKWIILL